MTDPTAPDSAPPRRRPALPRPGTVTPELTLGWLAAGWRMLVADPVVWVVQTVILILILAALGFIPFLGWAVAPIALPVLLGGMLAGAAAHHRGERVRIDHLFEGLRRHAGNLLMIGLFHLLGALLAALVAAAIGSSAALTGVVVGAFAGAGVAAGGVMLAVAVFTVLWVLLVMALSFSPALVMLQDVAPLDAMKLSAHACLSNLLTFLLFGLMLYVLTWIAMLPAGLGMLVLVPVAVGAIHAAWQDTFLGRAALLPPAAPDSDNP